jgi:putative ABC transport system permease protein
MRMTRLSLRMIADAPMKSLGTLIGVTVSVFLMLQQASLLLGILGRVSAFADETDPDIWVASAGTESTDATGTLPASRVGAAAGTPGVAWAAPVVQGLGSVTRPDGVRELVKVTGVEAPRYAGLPRSLAEGTTPASLRGSGRILMNAGDRETFGGARLGDRLEIDGRAVFVAGFFKDMDPHSPYYYQYANLDDARALTRMPADRITFVAVGIAPGEVPEIVKARLAARIPHATLFTRRELRDAEIRYFLVRSPVGVVFGMGTLIAALIGAAIVAVTLYSTVVDRTRDYGMLKAIGARRIDLITLLLAQAWSFALAGIALGGAAFFTVRYAFPSLPMAVTPAMLGGIAGAALVSCTAASLLAIRRVLSLDPALVFRS